jgi:uncharacterized protein YkwD
MDKWAPKRIVLSVGLVLGSLLSPAASFEVSASEHASIDTSNRAEVVAAYAAEFDRSEPDIGWTGDRATCSSGTTSLAYRDSMFSRVNWFRAMAGVPSSIIEDTAKSVQAQETALMMAESGRLSHTPDTSFACYTSTGDAMAGESNLALGLSGLAAINGYMQDPGANNIAVGHRNWILHPPTQTMGTGDIPSSGGYSANSLYVFNNVFGAQPALRESAGFVAWPPRGYVPGDAVYPRWSFGLRGADMSNAQVTVTDDAGTLTAPVVFRSPEPACPSCGSAPFPIVVFEPQGYITNPANDTTYTVTVTGVKVDGLTQDHSYTVAILGTNTPGESGNCRQAPVPTVFSVSDPNRASVYRLYCAYFLRYPDLGGFDYWYGVQSSGVSYKTISDSFELSQEFINTYGPLTDAQFLELVYENVLERSPDSAGENYWIGLLNADEVSRGDVMLYFSASQEFKNATGTN